jgi:hypothetical protein
MDLRASNEACGEGAICACCCARFTPLVDRYGRKKKLIGNRAKCHRGAKNCPAHDVALRRAARAWRQSHATFNPPPSSRHLQLAPSTRVTQPQLGFSAHSANQLQALPPLAFSSQYQPAGQMPLPHLLQVPSSQLGPFDFSGVAALLLDCSSSSLPCLPCLARSLATSLESAELLLSSPADLGPSLVAVPPPH